MSPPRLAPLAALALASAACSGSSSVSTTAGPDAGPTVVVAPGGVPRFVLPGAPAGTENQVTVVPGTTVTWRFMTSGYNVVAAAPDGGCVPSGVFCSPSDLGCAGAVPPQMAGSFYQHGFPDGGDYPYFSQPGCPQGMTGVVHVVPPDGGP